MILYGDKCQQNVFYENTMKSPESRLYIEIEFIALSVPTFRRY